MTLRCMKRSFDGFTCLSSTQRKSRDQKDALYIPRVTACYELFSKKCALPSSTGLAFWVFTRCIVACICDVLWTAVMLSQNLRKRGDWSNFCGERVHYVRFANFLAHKSGLNGWLFFRTNEVTYNKWWCNRENEYKITGLIVWFRHCRVQSLLWYGRYDRLRMAENNLGEPKTTHCCFDSAPCIYPVLWFSGSS